MVGGVPWEEDRVGSKLRSMDQAALRACAIIASCFLLSSTGYLMWLYRLMALVPLGYVDFLSMVVGYLCQAAGTGVYSLVLHGRPEREMRRSLIVSVALYVVTLVPVMFADTLLPVLVFGDLSNFLCGYIAGYYLHVLAQCAAPGCYGAVFGCGYAVATVATWLISLPAGGTLLKTWGALVVCVALAAVTVALVIRPQQGARERGDAPVKGKAILSDTNLLSLAILVTLLMCMVKNLGNGFPAADLDSGVDLELSRLLYAVSLIIAGLANDRSLKYGLICCLAALMMPFVTLSLSSTSVPGVMLWAMGYFLYGFFSVFRVVLFADLSRRYARPELSGWGFMVGHVGDSLGTALCLMLTSRQPALVMLTALFFAASVFLAFRFYQTAGEVYASLNAPAQKTPAKPPVAGAQPTAAGAQPTAAGARVTAGAQPTAGERPTAGAQPTAGERPTAGAQPTAGERPTATGEQMMAAERPMAGVQPTAADEQMTAGVQPTVGAQTAATGVRPTETGEQPSVMVPASITRKSERQLFEEFATTYAITARERDVLRLVVAECSNSEIAAELFVSEGTVKFHVRNLLKKTGCKNRLELIAKYVAEATN